jgi:hypothetical protein
METIAHAPSIRPPRALTARIARTMRNEIALVRLGLGIVALHIVDDNFLQPEPGTSAGDHLASGLVPVAILGVVAGAYPLLRAGLRAATAMTFGAIGVALGAPGAYYLLNGNASGDHYTGLLAIVAGAAVLLTGPVTLWKSRRSDGSRRRRYLRRSLILVAAVPVTWAVLWYLVFPVGFSYIYTHTGPAASTPELGVAYDRVTVTTSDSLELAAWYVPSKNRAAVVVFPGPARAKEARMLVRHGYGTASYCSNRAGRARARVTPFAGPATATCSAASRTSRTAATLTPIASAGSASRSAARSCSRPPRNRPDSKRSSRRAPASASETSTDQARVACSSRRPCSQ